LFKKKSFQISNGFRKPDADFYPLTGYYSRQQPSARWRHFLGMECVGVKRFLRFSRRREHEFARNFFFRF